MVTELLEKRPGWLTPGLSMSLLNFIVIIFFGGMIWQGTQGDIKNNKKDIDDLRIQITQLRASDTSTSVAVLKTDVQYIKDSLLRIEGRLDQRATSPR